MTLSRLRHLALMLSVLALSFGGAVRASERDTAYYPVSGRPAALVPAPAVLFEKTCELTVPGLPLSGPAVVSRDGFRVTFRTTEGTFEVAVAACSAQKISPVAPLESPERISRREPPSLESEAPGTLTPLAFEECARGFTRAHRRWLSHLGTTPRAGCPLEGPADIVADVVRDGTVWGRDARNGHVLWRTRADRRISHRAASVGDYLLLAPDASQALDAYRWSDGSLAGAFRLDSKDAGFASGPIASDGRISILATVSPRVETRFFTLTLHPATLPVPARN